MPSTNEAPSSEGATLSDAESVSEQPDSSTIARSSSFRRAALDYAARGRPVFPLQPRSKKPLTPHGFKDATTDPEQVWQWWTAHPDATIGVPTGLHSGVVVLDIDRRHGGDKTLAALEAHYGSLPVTPTVCTGDGEHRYLACGSGGCPRCTIGPGLDLQGDGAYVVVPPSIHPSGRPYRWLVSPEQARLASVPDWVLAGERAGTNTNGSAEGQDWHVPAGERNTWLFRRGCGLRRWGLSAHEVFACLTILNQSRCRPPLESPEVARIARSAAHYEARPDGPPRARPVSVREAVRRG